MRRGAPRIPLLAMNRDSHPLRNRFQREWAKPSERHESRCRRCAAATNGTSKPDRDKGASRSLRRSIGSGWLVSSPGASLRPSPVVHPGHLRLNLFAKLESNNVVGSLKG